MRSARSVPIIVPNSALYGSSRAGCADDAVFSSRVPQLPQKRMPSGFSKSQLVQRMLIKIILLFFDPNVTHKIVGFK
jgi:hypothetical protein